MPMQDDSLIKIMQSLSLNFNPAENAIKSFESRVASLNKQLFDLKANAIAGARDINQAFSSQLGGMGGGSSIANLGAQYSKNNVILDQYGGVLKKVKLNTDTMEKSYKSVTSEAKKHAESVQNVAKKYNILGNEMNRRVSWFMTGGLFYGGLAAVRETIKTISDVEMGITQIARVTNDATFSFKGMRDQLLQLGVDYGTAFASVQDIALRWTQAGYNVADTLELTKTALLAMNTAELNAEQSTVGFIAIMSQWGLTAKDLSVTLDKINKVGDDFAVTSQDLVDGLSRASGAAKIMGLSIDQTIALLTTMREASGRTGKEVGNALNSILSYIQRPSALKGFEALGIRVFADDAKTQFRNVMEVFSELAARWNDPVVSKGVKDSFVAAAQEAGMFSEELAVATGQQEEYAKMTKGVAEEQAKFTDIQKRDAAQDAAGIYRRNYFIGLLEKWATTQKVLNSINVSSGYSMRENARTMETLEKKYQSLIAAAQELAVALGDAGLLDILKALTDGAKTAAEGFSHLDSNTKTLIITSLELLGVVKALKSLGGLIGVKSSMASLIGVMPGWAKLIALVLAAAGAIGLYALNAKNAASGMSEEDKILGGLSEKYVQQKEKISNLKQGTDEYNTAQSEMQRLMNEIAKQNPVLITSLDEHAKITGIDEAAINKLAEAYGILQEAQNAHIQNLSTLTDEQLRLDKERLNSTVKTLQDQLKSEKAALEYYQNQAPAYIANEKKATNWLEGIGNFFYQNGAFGTGLFASPGWGKTPGELTKDDMSKTIKDLEDAQGKLDSIMGESDKRVPPSGNSNVGGSVSNTLPSKYTTSSLKILLDANKISLKTYLAGLRKIEKEQYSEYLNKSAQDINNLLNSSDAATVEKTKAYLGIEQDIQGAVERGKKGGAGIGNIGLQNELKKLEHAKNMNQLKGKNEIDWLNTINAKYKKTDEEQMDLDEKIFNAKKEHHDKSLQDALDEYENKKAHNQYTYAQEINHLWGIRSKYAAEGKERQEIDDKLTAVVKENQNELLEKEEDKIETTKSMSKETQVSIQKELDGYTKLRQSEGLSFEKKKEYDKKIYDLTEKLQDRKLQDSKDWISEQKSLGKLSTEYEIAAWNRVLVTQKDHIESVKEAKINLYRLTGQLADETYSKEESSIQHWAKMGIYSIEQQIEKYRELYSFQKLSANEQMKANEELQSKYKDLIQEHLDTVKDSIDEETKKIEQAAKYEIKIQQDKIDALDAQKEADDRVKSKEDHNKKIADLEKDLAYESVRTGEDHRKKMIEINEKIAEENKNWADQKHDWDTEDQKTAAQKEIDRINQDADDKKEALNTLWTDIQDIFKGNNLNLITAAMTTSTAVWDEWDKNFFAKMKKAIQSGEYNPSILPATGNPGAPSTVKDALELIDTGKKLSNNNKLIYDLAKKIAFEKDLYAAAQDAKNQSMMDYAKSQAAPLYDQLKVLNPDLVDQLKKSNNEQAREVLNKLPQSHSGSKTLSYGAAYLMPGQLIFPPGLSTKLEVLISALNARPIQQIQQTSSADNSRKTQINELLHVDTMNMGDDVDREILYRELGRVAVGFK